MSSIAEFQNVSPYPNRLRKACDFGAAGGRGKYTGTSCGILVLLNGHNDSGRLDCGTRRTRVGRMMRLEVVEARQKADAVRGNMPLSRWAAENRRRINVPRMLSAHVGGIDR